MRGGCCVAQSEEHETLDPGDMSLSSTLGIEMTYINKCWKKKKERTNEEAEGENFHAHVLSTHFIKVSLNFGGFEQFVVLV